MNEHDDTGLPLWLNDFAANTQIIRQVAKTQMLLDKEFKEQLLELQRSIYARKITLAEFWAQYKKLILQSVSQNSRHVQEILEKLDEGMQNRIKESQTGFEKQKPIDLTLPR